MGKATLELEQTEEPGKMLKGLCKTDSAKFGMMRAGATKMVTDAPKRSAAGL